MDRGEAVQRRLRVCRGRLDHFLRPGPLEDGWFGGNGARAKILGMATVGFKGTSKPFEGQPGAPEELYLRSSGTPLPVEVVQKGTTTQFDNWGEPIKVTAPLGAITIQASWLRK